MTLNSANIASIQGDPELPALTRKRVWPPAACRDSAMAEIRSRISWRLRLKRVSCRLRFASNLSTCRGIAVWPISGCGVQVVSDQRQELVRVNCNGHGSCDAGGEMLTLTGSARRSLTPDGIDAAQRSTTSMILCCDVERSKNKGKRVSRAASHSVTGRSPRHHPSFAPIGERCRGT